MTTPLFPLFLDLRDRDVLLLGAGEAADRRLATLERAGATVRRADTFEPALLEGCVLAIGAEAPEAALHAMFAAATARGIPVNVVDRPALSSFTTPAVVERLPLQLAIASGGSAPVLARLLRARIETLVDPAYGRLAAMAERFKAETRRRLPDVVRRRRMLERALSGRVAALMLAGNDAAAAATAYAEALAEAEAGLERPEPGIVHFVDPGPGEADLLTLRALRLLGEADVIVHGADDSPAVLDIARRDASREIAPVSATARLLELARAGRRVVRLAPAPGEADALAAAGVAVEFVPGVAQDHGSPRAGNIVAVPGEDHPP